MAARAGKHIHMENPGGLNPASFEEHLLALLKIQVMVFHTDNCTDNIQYVIELNEKNKNR